MTDQTPPKPKAQTLAPVTQQEILTMLVWSKASRDTRKVFENIQTGQRGQNSLASKTNLTGLYRHLEGYSADDSLGALIVLLEEEHLWEPKANEGNELVINGQVQNAVEELHEIYAALPGYREAFVTELDKPNSAIQATQRAPTVGRYCPYSVGLWASEKLNIKIHEWLDWSNFYLYAPDLVEKSWVKDARDEAHCHVLERLFEMLVNVAERGQMSELNKKRLFTSSQLNYLEPQSINVEGWRAFIAEQIDKLSRSGGSFKLPQDNSRKILGLLKKNPPLSARKLDPLGNPKRDCVHLMIAGIVVYLTENDFAARLRHAKGKNWDLRPALEAIDLKLMDRCHPKTAERIIQLSIDSALQATRS